MFIRSIKVRSSAGTVHEYVRVVSSIRMLNQPQVSVLTVAPVAVVP